MRNETYSDFFLTYSSRSLLPKKGAPKVKVKNVFLIYLVRVLCNQVHVNHGGDSSIQGVATSDDLGSLVVLCIGQEALNVHAVASLEKSTMELSHVPIVLFVAET